MQIGDAQVQIEVRQLEVQIGKVELQAVARPWRGPGIRCGEQERAREQDEAADHRVTSSESSMAWRSERTMTALPSSSLSRSSTSFRACALASIKERALANDSSQRFCVRGSRRPRERAYSPSSTDSALR